MMVAIGRVTRLGCTNCAQRRAKRTRRRPPSRTGPVLATQPHKQTHSFPTPAFHTHLFDPTRDYLGTKSERREMKRKLNIKEIFNIGQKKARKEKSLKEKSEKTVERKPRILKKRRERVVKLKLESEVKTEVKMEKSEPPGKYCLVCYFFHHWMANKPTAHLMLSGHRCPINICNTSCLVNALSFQRQS